MYKEKVQAYYDYTLPLYRLFWHGDTRAIHYGIWNDGTKNLKEALLNTNRLMADLVGVKADDRILDAGCGVGGSTLWLAKNRRVYAIGITISQKQLDKAKELAKRQDLETRTDFFLQDYTETDFPDSSFDVVWGLESVCHAVDKADFLKEAFRVLKPGGRLIVADGFLEKIDLGYTDQQRLRDFLTGLALDNLAEPKKFEGQLKAVGFVNVKNFDKTAQIIPTSVSMARMSRWSWPLSKITTRIRLTPQLLADNNKAGIVQLYLFRNRILTYRIFLAEKPA